MSLVEFWQRKRGQWLCWTGAHHYVRVDARWHKVNPWTTIGTNAKCRRCQHYGWENWGG